MNERVKFYEVGKPPASTVDLELQKKIALAESRLATLTQVVGADFGMKVKFGQLGGGSFFNPETNGVTLDPQILLEDKEYEGEFVAGHEGGHRAITRSLEQVGVPREKAMELYKKIGFGYANNCLEDCADNNWVGGVFPKFKEDSRRVYEQQFSQENAAMTTPEINQLIARLGYVPKFVSCGSEIIRQWATGASSINLDAAVADVLSHTDGSARKFYQTIPGAYAREGERLKKSKDRFKIFFEKIWPEFEKLVKMDIDEEKLRQLEDEMRRNEQRQQGQEGNPDESGAGDKPQDKTDKQGENGDRARPDENEKMDDGSVSPRGELTDEMRQKLQEIFDKLPATEKKRLEESAKKALEKLDDKLIKETRGKLSEDNSPPTHEEMRTVEEKEAVEREADKENQKAREREKAEDEKLSAELKQQIEGGLGEYEKVYQEIAPLADELYNRIHQIFLPQRHPRWQKGHPTGQRLDLAKVMQFQADRSLYDKIWERKTIPHKIDYRFTLLVDLSSSMQGKKTEQTFRGVILLAEVLNRLGIKAQILGFQDAPILYKDFDKELGPAIRKKMAIMRKEPYDQGEHNQASDNSDGYCLGEASKLLSKQKGKDNFLVVFSDGEPEPDQAHSGPEFDLKKIVAEIRKNTKQKLIGVGLGPNTEHVKDYYPTSLPNLDLKQMPELLGQLLEDMIKFPSRYK